MRYDKETIFEGYVKLTKEAAAEMAKLGGKGGIFPIPLAANTGFREKGVFEAPQKDEKFADYLVRMQLRAGTLNTHLIFRKGGGALLGFPASAGVQTETNISTWRIPVTEGK